MQVLIKEKKKKNCNKIRANVNAVSLMERRDGGGRWSKARERGMTRQKRVPIIGRQSDFHSSLLVDYN